MMVQRCMHSDFPVYGDVHRRSTCCETFNFTMNSSLKRRICLSLSSQSCALLHSDTNGQVPPVSSLSTYLLRPHLRLNLGATHLLTLAPFATSWWLPCHQHLMSCKATSPTHSPDQSFCKLRCSTQFLFQPLCLLFQLFPFFFLLNILRDVHGILFQTPSTTFVFIFLYSAYSLLNLRLPIPYLQPGFLFQLPNFSATRENTCIPTKLHLVFVPEHLLLS